MQVDLHGAARPLTLASEYGPPGNSCSSAMRAAPSSASVRIAPVIQADTSASPPHSHIPDAGMFGAARRQQAEAQPRRATAAGDEQQRQRQGLAAGGGASALASAVSGTRASGARIMAGATH
ncbi:hypothetical protein JOS77_14005 [Chromobacterium haemolyticum]|nr:hypothetical protein JOS77_14005 [Chromobacterium haemolyticum]